MGTTELQLVDRYRYLGCTINEYLDPNITGNTLAEGASRALGKLIAKFFQNRGLGYATYTKLYDSCVVPITDYSSGVWGYTKNEKIDMVQNRAARVFLGVNRFAPKHGIEGDIGWIPTIIRRKLNMIQMWNRVLNMDSNRLPRIVYDNMVETDHLWYLEVKSIFTSADIMDTFERNLPVHNLKSLLKYIQEKLLIQCSAEWIDGMYLKSKLCLYRTFKDQYSVATYCNVNPTRAQRALVAKIRFPLM